MLLLEELSRSTLRLVRRGFQQSNARLIPETMNVLESEWSFRASLGDLEAFMQPNKVYLCPKDTCTGFDARSSGADRRSMA